MTAGQLYWLLVILWVIGSIFSWGGYPLAGAGFLIVLFSLLGWKVFGAPLRKE